MQGDRKLRDPSSRENSYVYGVGCLAGVDSQGLVLVLQIFTE